MDDDSMDLERPGTPEPQAPDPCRAATFLREAVKANYSGRNDSGVAFGRTVLCPPRSYSGEREAQFLRHISTYFFFYANHFLAKGDAEVECMYVNDRLLLSANNSRTMELLHQQMLRERTLLDAMLTIPNASDERGARVVERFQDGLMSPELTEDVQFLAQGLSQLPPRAALELIAIRGQFEDVLTLPKFEQKLILVTGLNLHAEQKLLRVLIHSRLPKDTVVLIRGKKRPCFGCWLCLSFVADVMGYTGLNYNPRPGKAWTGAIDGLKGLTKLARDVDKVRIDAWNDKVIKMYEEKKIDAHVSIDRRSGAEAPGYDTESNDAMDLT